MKNTIKITWYGTASISIQTNNAKLLIDPYLTLRGSEFQTYTADFTAFRHIFLTHGHVDHLDSIPKILKTSHAAVYCTETPKNTLLKKKVKENCIRQIHPGDTFTIGDIYISVLQGKHIQFDKQLVRHTLLNLRMLKYFYNLPHIAIQNAICKENGETVAYLFQSDEKSILLLGSLALNSDTAYPTNVDCLVLPFQGAMNLLKPAVEVVNCVHPRYVVLDHFDDAFPPISASVNTDDFMQYMAEEYPEVHVIKPEPRMSIEI